VPFFPVAWRISVAIHKAVLLCSKELTPTCTLNSNAVISSCQTINIAGRCFVNVELFPSSDTTSVHLNIFSLIAAHKLVVRALDGDFVSSQIDGREFFPIGTLTPISSHMVASIMRQILVLMGLEYQEIITGGNTDPHIPASCFSCGPKLVWEDTILH